MAPPKNNVHLSHSKPEISSVCTIPLGTQLCPLLYKKNNNNNFSLHSTDTWYDCGKFHTAAASCVFSHLFSVHISCHFFCILNQHLWYVDSLTLMAIKLTVHILKLHDSPPLSHARALGLIITTTPPLPSPNQSSNSNHLWGNKYHTVPPSSCTSYPPSPLLSLSIEVRWKPPGRRWQRPGAQPDWTWLRWRTQPGLFGSWHRSACTDCGPGAEEEQSTLTPDICGSSSSYCGHCEGENDPQNLIWWLFFPLFVIYCPLHGRWMRAGARYRAATNISFDLFEKMGPYGCVSPIHTLNCLCSEVIYSNFVLYICYTMRVFLGKNFWENKNPRIALLN